MGGHLAIVGISFLSALLLSAVVFTMLRNLKGLLENLTVAPLGVAGVFSVLVFLFVLFSWYEYDFVADVTKWRFLAPVLGVLFICASFFIKKKYSVLCAVLIATIWGVFVGNNKILFFPDMPLFVNQVVTVVVWVGFSMGYRALSGYNPMPQMEGLVVALGFILLFLLGGAPFMMGVMASVLLAALVVVYINRGIMPFGIATTPVLGYIIGWFGVLSYEEYLLPSFVIFSMFYFMELAVCLIRKASLLPRFKHFIYNSIVVQAARLGMLPYDIIRSVWFIDVVLIIMGLFQINSENEYSIPCFVAILVAWQMYRILNWQDENKTFKEVNKELVKEINNSISNVWVSDKKTDKD